MNSSTAIIRGSTKLFFVVANPVAQVKAPQIFNQVFEAHGIDAVAVPAQVTTEHLEGFTSLTRGLGNAEGLMVSVPHKIALAGLVDRLDPVAQMVGSVNAVRRNTDQSLEGALFDGEGLLGALQHHGIDLNGRRVLLVGAGGAGLAIAGALLSTSIRSLEVHDSSSERAGHAVARLGSHAHFPISIAERPEGHSADLIIHATPLGMKETDPLPFNPCELHPSTVVFDILMMNRPTPLLQACQQAGLVALPGHEMLLHQVPAYLDFFRMPEIAHALREPASLLMRQLRTTIHGQMVV